MKYHKAMYLGCGYEGLTEGKVYAGKEEPGIFADRPMLVIKHGDNGKPVVAHLSRFKEVKEG